MKRHFVYTCLLALLIVAAGTVWAAQPASSPTPVEDEAGTVAPAPDADPILGERILEPVEVDLFCYAECFEELEICVDGCSTNECKLRCKDARDQCLADC